MVCSFRLVHHSPRFTAAKWLLPCRFQHSLKERLTSGRSQCRSAGRFVVFVSGCKGKKLCSFFPNPGATFFSLPCSLQFGAARVSNRAAKVANSLPFLQVPSASFFLAAFLAPTVSKRNVGQRSEPLPIRVKYRGQLFFVAGQPRRLLLKRGAKVALPFRRNQENKNS